MRGRLQNPLFEQEISITILETGWKLLSYNRFKKKYVWLYLMLRKNVFQTLEKNNFAVMI
jgi:hypothetical protein